jgi:hypothetical protein
MKSPHDEISEKLPEYVRGGVIPEEAAAHIRECADCREEHSLLMVLHAPGAADIPEPGGLFFETLPGKVGASLREGRKGKKSAPFLRFAAAFALIAVILTAGYVYKAYIHISVDGGSNEADYFSDPLAHQTVDLSEINEGDIPAPADFSGIEDIYQDETPFKNDYQRELASLSGDEMLSLYEALSKEQKNGGVL